MHEYLWYGQLWGPSQRVVTLFDGDCDGNDEVNTDVVTGLTAWVSWGDTGLDGLAESSCWKMIRMMLLLHYRVF